MTLLNFNLLRWNDVPRMSRISRPKIATFPQFSVYLSTTQAKEIINLLLHSNLYPVIYRLIKKKDELLYDEFGHSLWSANQLLAQEVKRTSRIFGPKLQYFLSFKYIEI